MSEIQIFNFLRQRSGFWLGFSKIQEFPYVGSFKVQLLSDGFNGRFIQYAIFEFVVYTSVGTAQVDTG